jgi:hypothetical protein
LINVKFNLIIRISSLIWNFKVTEKLGVTNGLSSGNEGNESTVSGTSTVSTGGSSTGYSNGNLPGSAYSNPNIINKRGNY